MIKLKIIITLISVVFLTYCSVIPPQFKPSFQSTESLIGSWRGTDVDGETANLIFFADGSIIFVFEDIRIGDSNVGSPYEVTYKVNSNTIPWELDIYAKENGIDMGVLRGLIEMIDDRTIRIGFDTTSEKGFGEPRPVDFSSLNAASIVILKKIN